MNDTLKFQIQEVKLSMMNEVVALEVSPHVDAGLNSDDWVICARLGPRNRSKKGISHKLTISQPDGSRRTLAREIVKTIMAEDGCKVALGMIDDMKKKLPLNLRVTFEVDVAMEGFEVEVHDRAPSYAILKESD